MSETERGGYDSRPSEPRDGNAEGSPEGDDRPEGATFRYSRARRLERAPESVRWLAARYGAKPAGIFGLLFATRASRLLFFTIVALAVAFNVVPFFSGSRSSGRLGEDRYSAKAFWFDGRVLVSLSRSGRALAEQDREVLTVTARIEGGAIASAGFIVGLAASEDFRMALDSGSGKPESVALAVSDGARRLDLVISVE
jgi:hypothetical protein